MSSQCNVANFYLDAAILGIGLALFTCCFEWIMITFLAIILGYFIGNVIYDILIKFFTIDPMTLYCIGIILGIVLILILRFIIEKYIMVTVTSFVGSYMIVRGSSLWIGHFPDETYVGYLVSNGEINQLSREIDTKVLAYLLCIAILTILGVIMQMTQVEDTEENEKDKDLGKAVDN